MDDSSDPLEECQDELELLVEENRLLRASANTFGDLAERLKLSLERERRRNARNAASNDRGSSEEEESHGG